MAFSSPKKESVAKSLTVRDSSDTLRSSSELENNGSSNGNVVVRKWAPLVAKEYYVARFVAEKIDLQEFRDPISLYQIDDNMKSSKHQRWREVKRRLARRRKLSTRREEQEVLRMLHDERPWHLGDGAQRSYEGRIEGEQEGNTFIMLVRSGSGSMHALEVGHWFNFRQVVDKGKQLSLDQAVEVMNLDKMGDYQTHWATKFSRVGTDGKRVKQDRNRQYRSLVKKSRRKRPEQNDLMQDLDAVGFARDNIRGGDSEEEFSDDVGVELESDHEIDYEEPDSDEDKLRVDQAPVEGIDLPDVSESEEEAPVDQDEEEDQDGMERLFGPNTEDTDDQQGVLGVKRSVIHTNTSQEAGLEGHPTKRVKTGDKKEAAPATPALPALSKRAQMTLDPKGFEFRIIRYVKLKGGRVRLTKLSRHFKRDVSKTSQKEKFKRAVKRVCDVQQGKKESMLVINSKFADYAIS